MMVNQHMVAWPPSRSVLLCSALKTEEAVCTERTNNGCHRGVSRCRVARFSSSSSLSSNCCVVVVGWEPKSPLVKHSLSDELSSAEEVVRRFL